MISLGIICFQGHSSAAALICDGEVVAAVAEERFSRKKSTDSFPEQSIAWLLKQRGITVDQIDHVAVGWCPKKTFLGQLPQLHRKSLRFLLEKRSGSAQRSRLEKFYRIASLKNEFKKRYGYKGKFSFIDHHLSHAISAFIQSGQKDCVVMVADGMGEISSTTIYEFSNRTFKILYSDPFPHSLGIFYSAATQFLGFVPDSDEYKVMGMAAYSQSEKYHEKFSQLYSFEGGHLKLKLAYFDIHKKANQFFSENYKILFGEIFTEEDKNAFAFSLQYHLNKIVQTILKTVLVKTSSRHFAASGGVFLNCLLNQNLRESELFDSYSFFPVADDNGTAIGAAQYVQWIRPEIQMRPLTHLYLGPEAGEVNEKLLEGKNWKKIDNLEEIAKLLATGKVVAWSQGQMEFGHRSLGNRSILASAQQKQMKDIINEKIKMRESFRPFAPSVLQEYAASYFEMTSSSKNFPFMIETFNARTSTKEGAPAIVHEDGTSRIQTVSAETNPKYYELLHSFYKLTGCPLLLNTSFNINGMPIVLSAGDAIDCFDKTHLDYLVIGDYLIWKK